MRNSPSTAIHPHQLWRVSLSRSQFTFLFITMRQQQLHVLPQPLHVLPQPLHRAHAGSPLESRK